MSDEVKHQANNQSPKNDASFWQEQHDEASAGSSQFLFPSKSEKTRIKLLAKGSDPRQFFREVESEYRGQTSKKYLVQCFEIVDPNDIGDPEIKTIVATKGIWAGITGLLAEGYTLFDQESPAVIITKTTGNRVSYSVMPSPPKIIIQTPEEVWAEAQNTDWDEITTAFAKMQEGRGGENNTPANALADAIVSSAQNPGPDQSW